MKHLLCDFNNVLVFVKNDTPVAWAKMLRDMQNNQSIQHYLKFNIDLLKKLKRMQDTIDVSILTASDKLINYPEVNEFISKYIPTIYKSIDFQLGKDNPELYTKILSKIGTTAEETAFIDDASSRVQAAGQVGIKTHHYTSNNECKQFLDSLL